MSELAVEFQSLPSGYLDVIALAQDRYKIKVTPLQLLVGGWSGAVVYLVSVSSIASNLVEHCILKLDRRPKTARSDEIARHNAVINKSTPGFARDHVAEIVFDRIEHEGAIAIFYRIAGQSLLKYRPLTNYERQNQLKTIFARTNQILLNKWNVDAVFQQAIHPQEVLTKWLGFRLDAGGSIETFIQNVCRLNPDIPGLLISGHVFPNPLSFARNPERWGNVRPIDIATGFIHGDLNTNNILVKFTENKEHLEGYYLIDFALFKEDMPLFYDQRYLEISYLMHAMSQVSFSRFADFLTLMSASDIPDPHKVPIEMSGISAVIAEARTVFATWLQENHPSMGDDLWGQYWLAGIAAGLAYCHKSGLPDELRLAGLIYSAVNLRRFASLFPLPRPAEVQQLYDEGQFGSNRESHTIVRRSADVQHNLPNQPTTFIGREEEIATARDILLRKDVQLVTFTGPGGTGKTRLSLEVARGLIDQFPDGVFFIPLADVSTSASLIARIAQGLEVRDAGSQPLFENLKSFLRDKNLLILLDNFEQLVSSASVIAELLVEARTLKVLVTSRILLNLRGEHELPILPLNIPEASDISTVDRLERYESVRLFVERARAIVPSFALTDANASSVAQICQRLDGLPLAIELAAARVKLLPPPSILARLSDRLKLLTGGAQDLPARQRTLRSTLDWSYSLLNAQERTLYARLSVFVDGFTLEAAEAVCNLDNTFEILEGITSLANNSLLKQEETASGEPRFRMLETIREYALERLVENGETSALRKQHAHYYAGIMVNEAGLGLHSSRAKYWLNWVQENYGNMLAALAWSQSTPEEMGLGIPLVTWLNWFWYRRGLFTEGRMWTDRVLASPALLAPTSAKATVLHMSAILAMWQGDLHIAEARARQGLALMQTLEDEKVMPWSLMGMGVILINRGKDREAHALLKEAQPLFQEQGLPYVQAITLVHLGNVALGLGNPVEAREWLEQAHRIFQEVGEEWGLSFVLNNLGEVARVQGDYDRAGKYYEESERLLRSTGDKGDLARFIHTLGYIAEHKGNYHQAETQFRESLAMFQRLGNKRGIAECIAGLASLRARQGNVQTAVTLLGAAEALLGASGAAWWPADRVEVEKTRSLLEAELEPKEYGAAWNKGQEMTLEQAIEFVSHA